MKFKTNNVFNSALIETGNLDKLTLLPGAPVTTYFYCHLHLIKTNRKSIEQFFLCILAFFPFSFSQKFSYIDFRYP